MAVIQVRDALRLLAKCHIKRAARYRTLADNTDNAQTRVALEFFAEQDVDLATLLQMYEASRKSTLDAWLRNATDGSVPTDRCGCSDESLVDYQDAFDCACDTNGAFLEMIEQWSREPQASSVAELLHDVEEAERTRVRAISYFGLDL